MSDLISRQAAIDDIKAIYEYHDTVTEDRIIDHLKRLPTAEKVGKWIPVSERLPNGQTEVIVSCCDDSGDSKYNYTSCGWMTRDGEYWIVDNEINYYVNAWMPLPEPWRGEER